MDYAQLGRDMLAAIDRAPGLAHQFAVLLTSQTDAADETVTVFRTGYEFEFRLQRAARPPVPRASASVNFPLRHLRHDPGATAEALITETRSIVDALAIDVPLLTRAPGIS